MIAKKKTAAELGALFHQPVVTAIDAAMDSVDSAKDATTTPEERSELLDDAKKRLSNVKEFYPGILAALDEQARNATPEQQAPFESKKFIAFSIMVLMLLLGPILTGKLGVPADNIQQIFNLAMMYIGVQGGVDMIKNFKK